MRNFQNITRTIRRRTQWEGHVERVVEILNAYQVMVGNPRGKDPLKIPKRSLQNNIKMDLKERNRKL